MYEQLSRRITRAVDVCIESVWATTFLYCKNCRSRMWPMFTISYGCVYIDIVGSSVRSKCEKIYSFPTCRELADTRIIVLENHRKKLSKTVETMFVLTETSYQLR